MTHTTLRAALWMMGAILALSSMALAGRALAADLSVFEIMTLRSAIGCLILSGILTATKRWGDVTRDRLGLHLMRNIAHFSGQSLWFFALTLIPLAQVFALEFTSPIWVLCFAVLFLGEGLSRSKLLAAALGFTGIAIIANPIGTTVNIGVAAAALSAIAFALTIITTKKLTTDQSIVTILFFMTLMQSVIGLAITGYDGIIAWPRASLAPLLLVVALAGLGAHFCMTKALSIAPATVIVPLDFLRLPLIGAIGFVFYNEALAMTVPIGAALILLANILNLHAATASGADK